MMRSLFTVALLAVAAQANAGVLTEDFDTNYAGWTNRWFAQNSNATQPFFDVADRGANPTGLTIYDGDQFDGGQVKIVFDTAFAKTIKNFSFDILGYNQQTLTVFDVAGNLLLNTVITATDGPPYDFADSKYTHFSVSSTNGIGGFSLLPFGAEYNYSIDNLAATVPEPGTWALMIGGFGLVGAAMRRRTVALTA